MNNNLKEYIESFDNIIWLYRDIIDNKILGNENLKNIDNEAKKELFDYIFDKYLDSESELNSLSIDARYYGFFKLKDIEIFLSIEEYCNRKIKNEIEKMKISNVRDIFMHLDMSLFLDDKSLLNKIPFSEYLPFISDSIKDINYGNGYYYAKSMSLIFIINLLLEKYKEKSDIDEIVESIKKFDEFGQYNILEYIIYSLTKKEIKSGLIYDNLIKYCIELFNEEKLRKSFYDKRIIKILYTIINSILDDNERLKYILDIYFTKDEKELEKIYKYIDYEERYKLDIPIYCLLRLTENKIDIKSILTDAQYRLVIMYLALKVKNINEIIVKNIAGEDIDLSIYWDLVRKQFLKYCGNYDIKQYGLFFLDRYRNLLEFINPTKEEFEKFSEAAKNFFYWYIIKEDNKELYPLIPKEIKKAIETDKRYREKIEEEKDSFQKERVKCVHKFFYKNRIIEDIDNIIKVLGNNPTFQDLSFYNSESYKDKYENKEKYLQETERVIVNPFIIDYYLIISRIFLKNVFMDRIKEYVDKYWDKHWGIQLYNYLKRHSDIKVNFSEKEKGKIKDYFKSSNYKENIKDLHNCLEGTFDNSYLYFVFYNIKNVFRIEFEYDEEILINMLKVPYDYYKGDIKLFNNNYYLEYFGVIMEYDADNIDFDRFFISNEEMKNSILKKLIENIDKNKITNEFGSYYALLSIIKLYNSDKEKLYAYYDKIVELVIHFYILSLDEVGFSQIYNIINNFIQENNLDNKILYIINKSNQVNYDHLKYINNLQRKLLEEERLYASSCYKLIYEIRIKINSKNIRIMHNISSRAIEKIKYELGQLCKNSNFDYLNQEEFINLKNQVKNISDKFINDTDLNFEENMIYYNLLYLQSFIIENIEIWKNFTYFLINNVEYYFNDFIVEDLIFNNLFEQIDKNNFNFDFFIDNLILLYNSIIEKPYKDGVIPNETLIHNFLNRIIFILSELNIPNKFYTKIYNSINNLNFTIKKEIQKSKNYEIIPFKIRKELNKKDNSIKYIISNLNGNDEKIFDSIENIIDYINNKYIKDEDISNIYLSRILYFKYLLKDINNRCLTIAHPSSFEDIKERVCKFSDKLYICCFSKTDITDTKDAYALWKIYGQVIDNKFENIKIRITLKISELIKNILDKGCVNFIYYFGDIDYTKDKDKYNIQDKDFFQKDDSFFFENEFRILVDCKCENDNRVKRDSNNLPYLLELPINVNLYRMITLDNKYSFNPYKIMEERDKNAVKYLLKEAQDKI